MKVISSLLALLAAALCAGCSIPSTSSDTSNEPTGKVAAEDSFAVALQHMPALLASNKVPGAVVSYIKNGEIAWTKAFGLADL
jgi:CubicO group peptidase (beta-lactamase class C family)